MSYISESLRQRVIVRACHCCEYCLLHEDDSALPFQMEHVIAEKHRGASTFENLAWSCPDCNVFKGTDIASIDWDLDEALTPLFNPRTQNWSNHFRLDNVKIEPLTAIGRVTAFILRMNGIDRLIDRSDLNDIGRYPYSPMSDE